MMAKVGFVVAAAMAMALSACTFHELPGVHHPGGISVVCLRYVAGDGIRGRTVSFASYRIPDFTGALRYSHRGPCVSGSQGPAQSYAVCLPRASACNGPQTRDIFPDEFPAYRDSFPGLRFGACEAEAKDECLKADQRTFGVPEDGCWQYDNTCEDRYSNPQNEDTLLPPVPEGGVKK